MTNLQLWSLLLAFSPLLLYVAFRLASAGWHRSKVEIDRRYNQGDNNGKT